MQLRTVGRIVRATVIVGIILQAATIAIAALAFAERGGTPFVSTAATVVMVATLALLATFVVVQLFPNGRAHVPVLTATNDGWTLTIMSTMVPGALWHPLGDLAGSPMNLIMSGFATPLFLSLFLVVGRQLQLRRLRAAAGTQASQG